MRIIILLLLSIANWINIQGQSNIDHVIAQISKNNKSILATTQYYEALKIQFKTGIAPVNPVVEYDYLSGSPANAGNQHDFLIIQQFDFPTSYFKKLQLANEQIVETDFQHIALRQDVLLEAKKYCIQLVYHNKLQMQLNVQKQHIEKILGDIKTKMDQGDGTILEVNKARLQLIEIKKQVQENSSAINQINQKLIELNGGIEITLQDSTYPMLPSIPEFAQLESDYERVDPLLKILQQQRIINQKHLELSKAMRLPKFEIGYHYQGILGQTYNGFHTGVSLPLWENKNTVKQKQAQLIFSDLELEAHKNEHYYHIKHIYEKYINLKITLQEYQTIFSTLNNNSLLTKALYLGELTTIQYFAELNFYTQSMTNYLQTERDYYETIAELYKYQL